MGVRLRNSTANVAHHNQAAGGDLELAGCASVNRVQISVEGSHL